MDNLIWAQPIFLQAYSANLIDHLINEIRKDR